MNKFLPGPDSTATFYPIPRKFPTPFHKKLSKLERGYDKAEGRPLTQARIERAGEGVLRKMKKKGVEV